MIKELLKRILPMSCRRVLRIAQKRIVYGYRRVMIVLPVTLNLPMKVIVGAAMTSQEGWYSTNEQWLDITNKHDWDKIFLKKRLITHVVAEHVFEHLTHAECQKALRLINYHMMDGGRIRIAVPDGYNPDSTYISHVGISGIGADASDHKQLLNKDSLSALLKESGFNPELLEGYDRNGSLINKRFNVADGYIFRSRNNPANMSQKDGWEFPDANTSLIIDGIKE